MYTFVVWVTRWAMRVYNTTQEEILSITTILWYRLSFLGFSKYSWGLEGAVSPQIGVLGGQILNI